MIYTADQIKNVLFSFPNLSQTGLSRFTGISKKRINFQLNHAKNLSDDIRIGAKEYFERNHISLVDTETEQCSTLNKKGGKLLSEVNMRIGKFHSDILKAVEDDKLTENEKKLLIFDARDLKKNFVKQIENQFAEIIELIQNARVVYK